MKRTSALVVLAVLGFAVAGCGSAQRGASITAVLNTVDTHSPSGTIYVTGTKTFVGLKVGTPIACKGSEGLMLHVPFGDEAEVEGGPGSISSV